jgi:hypothetical protein
MDHHAASFSMINSLRTVSESFDNSLTLVLDAAKLVLFFSTLTQLPPLPHNAQNPRVMLS